jgi:hypothetical protein
MSMRCISAPEKGPRLHVGLPNFDFGKGVIGVWQQIFLKCNDGFYPSR